MKLAFRDGKLNYLFPELTEYTRIAPTDETEDSVTWTSAPDNDGNVETVTAYPKEEFISYGVMIDNPDHEKAGCNGADISIDTAHTFAVGLMYFAYKYFDAHLTEMDKYVVNKGIQGSMAEKNSLDDLDVKIIHDTEKNILIGMKEKGVEGVDDAWETDKQYVIASLNNAGGPSFDIVQEMISTARVLFNAVDAVQHG